MGEKHNRYWAKNKEKISEQRKKKYHDMKKQKPPTPNEYKIARIEAGLKQKEIADLTGLSVHTIKGYEQGKFKPSMKSLEKLKKYIKVTH